LTEQYAELVKEVEAIEKEAVKVEFNFIDISAIEAMKFESKRPPFKPLLDLAMNMEAGKVLKEEPQKPQPIQQIKQIVQMQVGGRAAPSAPVPTSTSIQNTIYIPEQTSPQSLQQPAQEVQKPTPVQNVKEEMSAFAKKLPSASAPSQPINTFQMKVDSSDDIILPKLSIQDQISELERMIEGIKEHVFNADQLNVIKKEVNGLSAQIMQERKGGAPKDTSDIQAQLVLVRDQRIGTVISALSGTT
jgi:hypothetical protein